MRYRLMATYQGVPYEAGIGPSDGDVVLFAACPPPEELGFEPATGHWRKQLRAGDVQALWESRPMGLYRGQRCLVLDDLGDRLHIAYLGHDAYTAQQLGYWQVDRGVFELVAPRDEVTEIMEERSDYPGDPAGPEADPRRSEDYRPATTDYGPATTDFGLAFADYGPATTDYGTTAVPAPAGFGDTTRPLREVVPPPRSYPVIPLTREPPLPLEAAAMRAASAAAHPGQAHLVPQPPPPSDALPAAAPDLLTAPPAPETAVAPVAPAVWVTPPAPETPPVPGMSAIPVGPAEPEMAAAAANGTARRRRSARSRMATQGIFTELAALAAIPSAAYAVGEEVDGALCLLETATGYEVFSAAGGARHEVRVFDDEESAYFYLFGVLAAEAVRTGLLIPHR
ncbi:MAG: hypothetical protein ABSA03_05185 [Streptosporangiaceae bacterium]